MRVTHREEARMRGDDHQQAGMWSYIAPEQRVPADHPLRPIRAMVAEALVQLDGKLEKLYASSGRPSIAPERLIRALLLQVLYTIRSERQLMEQLDRLNATILTFEQARLAHERDRIEAASQIAQLAQRLRRRQASTRSNSQGSTPAAPRE